MNEELKLLLDTANRWLPALTWLSGQLIASRPGQRIEAGLRSRLRWLKDRDAERAFQAAFRESIEQYDIDNGESQVAQSVARVLVHVAEHDAPGFDRALILRQVFAASPDPVAISDLVRRYAFAIEGQLHDMDEVSRALGTLISDYMRPTFRANSYFAERVGFAEVIGLLQELLEAVREPLPNLDELRNDYCAREAEKYELLTMQGISPKVQNRTIGIRMEEVFIPLRILLDEADLRKLVFEAVAPTQKSAEAMTAEEISPEPIVRLSTRLMKYWRKLQADEETPSGVFLELAAKYLKEADSFQTEVATEQDVARIRSAFHDVYSASVVEPFFSISIVPVQKVALSRQHLG